MADVLLPEQYLETLKVAIAQKKNELEKLELVYAKIAKALAPDSGSPEDAKELTRQRIAEAQRQHHARRRKEIADRILAEHPNWKQYKGREWELAGMMTKVTPDAICRIFSEDERFKGL